MGRKREHFIDCVNPSGEIVVKGQFWELKEPGKKPPRYVLCSEEEKIYKSLEPIKIRRSEKEQHNFITRLYAEKLTELMAEVKEKQKELDESRLVSRLMQDWLEYVETKGTRETKIAYKATVDYYLEAVGDHDIEAYDYKKYLAFLKHLQKVPNRMGGTLSDIRIRGHFRQLRAFYNWCFKHRILDRAFYIELPQETKKEQRPYESHELIELRKAIQRGIDNATRKNHRICRINDMRALIMLAYTGMRRGAIWSLRLDHIDMERRIIRIRKNEELNWNNKKLKERDKPISEHLYRFLQKDLASRCENEVYFNDDGTGQPCYKTPGGLTKAFTRARDDAGLPREIKPIKAIRNHGVNLLIERGTAMRVAQQYFDHESIITTAGYTNNKRFESKMRDAAELVSIGWENDIF